MCAVIRFLLVFAVITWPTLLGTKLETLKKCCSLGTNYANSGLKCTSFQPPIAGVAKEDESFCLNSVDVCCKKQYRQKQCELGQNEAKSGKGCSSSTGGSDEGFHKDCCEACELGMETGSTGQSCQSDLGLGPMMEAAFVACCNINLPSTSSSAVSSTLPTTATVITSATSPPPKKITKSLEKYDDGNPPPPPTLEALCDIPDLCAHICIPTGDSYRCECHQGFTLMADGISCKPSKRSSPNSQRCIINNPCDHECTDTGVAIKCSCYEGYKLDSDKRTCIDIDECDLGIHDCESNEICVNNDGDYDCQIPDSPDLMSVGFDDKCPEGYKFNGEQMVCDDIDECEIALVCPKPGTCINTIGSFKCEDSDEPQCPPGFFYKQSIETCDDIDECITGKDDCNRESQICLNTKGNYTCIDKASRKTCPPGFKKNVYTQLCEDIDECEENDELCGENEECVNEPGGHNCIPKSTSSNYPGSSISQPTLSRVPTSYNPPSTSVVHPTSSAQTPQNIPNNNQRSSSPTSAAFLPNSQPQPTQSQLQPQTPNFQQTYPQSPQQPSTPSESPQYPSETPVQPSQPSYQPQPRPSQPPYQQPQPSYQQPQPVQQPQPSQPPFQQQPRPSQPPYQQPQPPYQQPQPVQQPQPSQPPFQQQPQPAQPPFQQQPQPPFQQQPQPRPFPHPPYYQTPQYQPRPQVGKPAYLPYFPPNPRVSCSTGYRFSEVSNDCVDIDECREDAQLCDSNQDCYNTVGSYICNCKNGFTKDYQTGACVDVNECQIGQHDCSEGMRCDNTIGSFICSRTTGCGTGYTLNSATGLCEDDDECSLGLHNCHDLGPKFQCRNTLGSYRCERIKCIGDCYVRKVYTTTTKVIAPKAEPTPNYPIISGQLKKCLPGYKMNQHGVCEDINECDSSPCKKGEKCLNLNGRYQCIPSVQCKTGYEMNEAGNGCVDINECTRGTHKCKNSQICKNGPGYYICQCPPGHKLNHENECEDINECEFYRERICSRNAKCINTVGSYTCKCKEGFRESGHACDDIDECAETAGLCEQNCVNLWGSYRCSCERGFTLSADNRTCTDINECEKFKDKNLCIGTCQNAPGSYTCKCPDGYRLGADGRTCQDVDECERDICRNTDDVCVNTRGSYKCHTITCPANYIKDPEHKSRCKRASNVCDIRDINCIRMPGQYSYHFVTFVSNLPIPDEGRIDFFQMKGPAWASTSANFDMNISNVRCPRNVKQADDSYFRMKRDINKVVVSLVKPITGPQEIELQLQMELYMSGVFQGKVVSTVFVYVSEFEF